MKFSSLATLFFSVLAAPAPKTNYELLANAITDFQMSSDYSWELIITALGQEKALLNSFSTDTVGNLTLFLPSDAGFLSLNVASLTQNDLYTYLQYHFAIDANPEDSSVRTFLGDDVLVNGTIVTSALNTTSEVLGSISAGDNVIVHFIDTVMRPPVTLKETAEFYGWTNLLEVLEAADEAKLTITSSKDNTFLVPSEESIAQFVQANCPPSQWTPSFLESLLQSLTFSSGRYYSSELGQSGTITSNSFITADYVVEDGKVTFTEFGIEATVVEADILIHEGVVHVVDALGLPAIKGFCSA